MGTCGNKVWSGGMGEEYHPMMAWSEEFVKQVYLGKIEDANKRGHLGDEKIG